MADLRQDSATAHLESDIKDASLTLRFHGRLDAVAAALLWRKSTRAVESASFPLLIIDASAVDYCDGAGMALFVELQRLQGRQGGQARIEGLSDRFVHLLDQYDVARVDQALATPEQRTGIIEDLGRHAVGLLADMYEQVVFLGQTVAALAHYLAHPLRLRWRDAFSVAEQVGANALPIIALVGFLMGVVLAYQSAIPLRQFGAEIFVANLIGLSLLRELGPLVTAIVVAGRSGSAFAAEIGTMKVGEELDALHTMGLDPVRLLVVVRVLVVMAMMPLLTLFFNLFGLVGGGIVMMGLGFPAVTYVHQILAWVSPADLIGGLVKSVFLGLLVAGIGCLRGLQTKAGPSAVGESTTRAVVGAIILITIADGTFAVLYYSLGI